jgi:sulfatase maturation enzyme AslB (radical SAM superfamily)
MGRQILEKIYNKQCTHTLLILYMQYLLYILTKFDIPFLPISYLCNAYCIYCLDWTFQFYRSPVNAVRQILEKIYNKQCINRKNL